jgi:putative peptide zinc metalloprotease protein
MAVAWILVKVMHELGHALALHSIGRKCHEMGVMLLAFIPCLYCNVSDVWLEPNRWKRMLVSAAGIYVEIMIACLCLPLWLWSRDGPVQTLLFAVMIGCSLNTVLINGNPLLRYDGYYLFSDWFEIPNLAEKARQSLSSKLRFLFFEDSPAPDAGSFLDVYAVASVVYRWFVLAMIATVIYMFFRSRELPGLGIVVAGLMVAMTVLPPLAITVRRFSNQLATAGLRTGRTVLLVTFMIAMAWVVAWWPIRTRVVALGITALDTEGVVYAPDNGRIEWNVQSGQRVSRGDPLATIESKSLQFEICKQQQRVAELQLGLQNLELLQKQGAENAIEIELQESQLKNAVAIQSQLENQREQLAIRAPSSGKLIPATEYRLVARDPLDLRRLNSTLNGANRGAFVEAGEPIAVIVSPRTIQARLQILEQNINRVAIGDEVRIWVPQFSPGVYKGKVSQIGIDSDEIDSADRGEREVKTSKLSPLGQSSATAAPGQVVVLVELGPSELDESALYLGSAVKASIVGPKRPLYQIVTLWLRENFKL